VRAKTIKKCLIYVSISVLVLIAFIGILPRFFPWTPVNCWTYEVDIYTGRIRYTRYFCFIQVKRYIVESAISQALRAEDYIPNGPEWHAVLTLSPGIHNSPHYVFHSAMNDIKRLEGTWQCGRFTFEARRQSAKRIITLWQESKNDSKAGKYIFDLEELALENSDKNKTTSEQELLDFELTSRQK
jgi:hypothetical protein